MASTPPRHLLAIRYEEAAQAYLCSLPPEHFLEATPKATQRKITLESLDLVSARRPEVQVFNELLVQYPLGDGEDIEQAVPDNMAVVSDQPVRARTSFNLPLESAVPFWVMEYVSDSSRWRDYGESFRKYERDLKVRYYLAFYPDGQELTLFRHTGRKYVTVKPNERGRYAIPELEIEVALHDGWVRYWYQGELLPLPADLQRDLDEARREAEEAKRQAEREKRRADRATRRADDAERRAGDAERRAEQEQEARRALEAELAQLRAQLERRRNGS
jgi:Uma2 family endonuclease